MGCAEDEPCDVANDRVVERFELIGRYPVFFMVPTADDLSFVALQKSGSDVEAGHISDT